MSTDANAHAQQPQRDTAVRQRAKLSHHESVADRAQGVRLGLHVERKRGIARTASDPVQENATKQGECLQNMQPTPALVFFHVCRSSLTAMSICRGARSQGATSPPIGGGGGVGVLVSAAAGSPLLLPLLGCCSARTRWVMRCWPSDGRPAGCRLAAWPKARACLQ